MTWTPRERGALAAQMAIFLESLCIAPGVSAEDRREARRLVDLADEAWATPTSGRNET